jgi:hypothetical protein
MAVRRYRKEESPDLTGVVREVARQLPPAQWQVVQGRYWLDRSDWTIGRIAGKTENSVRQAHFCAIRTLKVDMPKGLLGLDETAFGFLLAYYKEDPCELENRSSNQIAQRARERAAPILGVSTAAVDDYHAGLMATLVERARQLELHRRDSNWKTVIRRYFRATTKGGSPTSSGAAEAQDEDALRSEFDAMRAIVTQMTPKRRSSKPGKTTADGRNSRAAKKRITTQSG